MTLDEFLSRLQGVRKYPGYFKALCPAHEDKAASLSIREMPNGKINVTCHAGCAFMDIMDVMHVKAYELYPEDQRKAYAEAHSPRVYHSGPSLSGSAQQSQIEATYDYVNEEGILLYQTLRYNPKDFKQRRPDPEKRGDWIWNLQEVRRVLFNLTAVLEAVKKRATVFVVEGEKDAVNLTALGFCATTNVGGAGKWKPQYTEVLKTAKRVVIIPDQDEPGLEAAAKIHDLLPNSIILELPNLPPKGDVSDWIAAGGTKEDLQALVLAQIGVPSMVLSNFERVDKEKAGLPIRVISNQVFEKTHGWPKRVGPMLFTEENHMPRWIQSCEALFGWLQERFNVQWSAGLGIGEGGLIPKGEFHAHVCAAAENFEAIEAYPHEPKRPDTYYMWAGAGDYKAKGEYLNKLVAMFANVAEPEDADLIKAAFVTPCWGGPLGARPAFIIIGADRGFGKTTLATTIGQLYGGIIQVEPGKGAGDRLLSRLLSPDALTQRVVMMDNVKYIAESAIIEGLITMEYLSGYRLYFGEGKRPNTLTWIFTANTPRLSRDLADRSFIIRLVKPTPVSGWKESVEEFVLEHRDKILADCCATLQRERFEHEKGDRWQSWTDNILARVTPNTDGVLSVTRERRDDMDEEIEEVNSLQDAFKATGKTFISSTEATEMLNSAFSEQKSARFWTQKIKAHIESGRLKGISRCRSMNCNGYSVNFLE